MISMNCIVVCGPTVSGKTKLAVQIAGSLNGEILSADSRQVYRGMDIGTGKDLHEYVKDGRSIPYHLIDIVDPSQIYTLYDYQRDFYKAFRDVTNRSHMPIVAGGTGLYIEAVLKGYHIAPVPEDVEFRKSLMAQPYEKLLQTLESENPQLLAKADISTKKRIVRALEISRSGFDVCRDENEGKGDAPDFPQINPLILYLVWDRAILRERIERRLHERFQNGMIDEVAKLLESGISVDRLDLFGMEYRHIAGYLTKKVSYEQMTAELLQGIFHLAKRQDTWFRGMERRGMKVHHVQTADFEDVKKILSNNGMALILRD